MTMPNQPNPGEDKGAWKSPTDNQHWNDDNLMKHLNVKPYGKWNTAQNRFRVNGRALEDDLRLINKHEGEIGELVDAYKQLILQGEAQVFTRSGMYRKTEGVVSIEVIMISGGGGGGAGKWDIRAGNFQGGGFGGAGGGEIYAKIPAILVPDEMLVEVHWDGFGAGGVGSEVRGTGGGTVKFGNVLTAVGGQGGLGSNGRFRPVATGGTGLIPGGDGGGGWVVDSSESEEGMAPARGSSGGNSTYAGELRGGGGGGGGGSPWAGWSWSGGTGAAFPGGDPGQDGMSPAQIIATGGGGGGGGTNSSRNGGNGGWPGGGGGGGCGGTLSSNNGNGGNGASGAVYVIERMT